MVHINMDIFKSLFFHLKNIDDFSPLLGKRGDQDGVKLSNYCVNKLFEF